MNPETEWRLKYIERKIFFSQKILCHSWRRQKQTSLVKCSLFIKTRRHTSKKQPCSTGHLSNLKVWMRRLPRTDGKCQLLLNLQSSCNGQDNFDSLLTQAYITRKILSYMTSVWNPPPSEGQVGYSGESLAIPRSAHVFCPWSTVPEDTKQDLVCVKGLP